MGSQRQEGGLGLPSHSVSLHSRSSVFGVGLFSRGLWIKLIISKCLLVPHAELHVRVMSTRQTRLPQTAGQLRAQEKEPSPSGGWVSAAGAAGGSLGQMCPLSFLAVCPAIRCPLPPSWSLCRSAQGPAGAHRGCSGVARVFPHLRPPAAFALFSFFLPTSSPPPPTKPSPQSSRSSFSLISLGTIRAKPPPLKGKAVCPPLLLQPATPPREPQSPLSPTYSVLSLQTPVRTMQAGFSRAPRGARMAAQPAFCGPPRTTASS